MKIVGTLNRGVVSIYVVVNEQTVDAVFNVI